MTGGADDANDLERPVDIWGKLADNRAMEAERR